MVELAYSIPQSFSISLLTALHMHIRSRAPLRAAALALALAAVRPPAVRAQWVAQSSPTDAELRGLSVVSPRVVWASGMRGTVIHTLDGGQHWTRDTVP